MAFLRLNLWTIWQTVCNTIMVTLLSIIDSKSSFGLNDNIAIQLWLQIWRRKFLTQPQNSHLKIVAWHRQNNDRCRSSIHHCAEKLHLLFTVRRTLKKALFRKFNLIVACVSSIDCGPINPIGDIEENKDKDKKNCKSRIPCKELLQLWWGTWKSSVVKQNVCCKRFVQLQTLSTS